MPQEENNKKFSELTVNDFPPILYRCIKSRHLDSFMKKGVVSFGQAQNYLNSDGLTEGQADDEQSRHYEHDIKNTHFFINGYPIEGLTKASLRLGFRDNAGNPLNYYLLCCSFVHNKELLKEFNANICIEIIDVKAFSTLICNEIQSGIVPLDFAFGKVTYYDPMDSPKSNRQLDLIFNKLNKFSHQKEYRFAIIDKNAQLKGERFELALGTSLESICRVL